MHSQLLTTINMAIARSEQLAAVMAALLRFQLVEAAAWQTRT
jgi:hypothetical protein